MFAVIFEVNPYPDHWDEYLHHAGLLRPELVKIDGFIVNERYASLRRPGWLVSLSLWRDEKSVIRWRTHALHHEIQGKGRSAVFADYHLRVGEVVADTQPDPDVVLLQQRFDSTEIGAAKAVTVTERPLQGAAETPATMPGLLETDMFDSITQPGNGLWVNSWRDLPAAEAAIPSMPGRHRVVRVIRDYGMFARGEAPQYFPRSSQTNRMNIPAEQQAVADFLGSLSCGGPKETHISAVFVGGDTVYKLKKAVRLPFVDFLTLPAREHFLRRELALNQPAAPGIYRDVAAVVRSPDGTLDLRTEVAGAPVVDWVLRMAVVPEADFLDVIASRFGLTAKLQDALGDCVAQYHAGLAPVRDCDHPAKMRHLTQGNVRSARAAGLPQTDVEAWRLGTEAAIRTLCLWLARRAEGGFVRRCHGDLHLGNLCLWDGRPVPFDALEFDEAMATIDIGYDLAFLLMDLDQRVDRAAANRVMNRSIARSGDAAATRGFSLFLSQRGMVRAHVAAASGQADDARRYLAAARAYLARPPACVLAIGGLPGCGKSTLARLLAPDLGRAPGAVILRSDEVRKRQHGVAPEARLPPDAYAEAANAAVNAALLDQARVVAEGGHAVILDATFIDPELRRAAAAAARDASVPFLGVWLDVELAELEARIQARRDDASDATLAVLRRTAAVDTGAMDWMKVDGRDSGLAATAIRRAIRLMVGSP